jgi:hypothetical protein
MKKALIVQGGWEGHMPQQISARLAGYLRGEGFEVTISDTLEAFSALEPLLALDLIVPCWTMGEIAEEGAMNISKAVGAGVGLAGCHGFCDMLRNNLEWHFMTGGQFVSHPGGDSVEYTVNICHGSSAITDGVNDFTIKSEQYYLHVDPAVEVLATTQFPAPGAPYYHITNKPVQMPVAWTKYWGNGRVFYSALGHNDELFEVPEVAALMKNGMLWAADKTHRGFEL